MILTQRLKVCAVSRHFWMRSKSCSALMYDSVVAVACVYRNDFKKGIEEE